MKGVWNPKIYEDRERMLSPGMDLTKEQSNAMEKGEIFTLISGGKVTKVLKDSYGYIMEMEANDEKR